ncbi:MAG: polysaccharide biosynthesis protein [Salinivirgaceae bacterium]|nr:polysaccharide biosynthesis protein [Salinivirgaceae bacterium]
MSIFSRKYTPRWIVLIIDVFISTASIVIAYLLRFNFEIPENENVGELTQIVELVVGVRFVSFLIAGTYAGIVRYTGLRDAKRIFITITSGSLFIVATNLICYYSGLTQAFIVPMSIVAIEFLTTLFFMISLRFLVKSVFFEFRTTAKSKNVIVYGTDRNAQAAKHAIEEDRDANFKVVAFVDDIAKKSGKKIDDLPIYPIDNLENLTAELEVRHLLLAKPFQSVEKKQEIIELGLNNGITMFNVPKVESWINGELSSKQIKNIKIEDLLERNPIQLDFNRIQEQVKGETILVTGAAGSIGSEIVRQLIRFEPHNIVLFDQAETPMYDIEMELRDSQSASNITIVIGDITDEQRVREVFELYKPEIVYHAAAYKHVPMMENNPVEAVRNNVLGTRLVADMAVKYGVSRFVMVSTDKAVNPTNVMGASKRIAEIYTQSLNGKSATRFITTRFGNVLGSNGSVIPRFKKQIEEGGPITVTHPQITRYFMTIPEACQLVLEAGASGKGGEIFIFDMGKSVKIVDLAKKMIKLSGLELGKDIQIVYTGLRPGEKLYEELLANKENTIPTPHPQIMVAKVREYNHDEANAKIDEFVPMIAEQDNVKVVRQMKMIVPEFMSQNSIYEELDREIGRV